MNATPPSLLQYPYAEPPPPGGAVEVAPGLLWIRMPLPFALDHINLWLAREPDGRWTAVDSGYGNDTTRGLWEGHFAATLERGAVGCLNRRRVPRHHEDGNRQSGKAGQECQ